MSADKATQLIHHPYRAPAEFDAVPVAVHKASTVFFKNVADLRSRVTRTIALLDALTPDTLAGAERRHITVPLRTRTLSLDGLPFIQRWTLPNFYFHVTTAYDILRHNGVELGKRDFIGPI